MLYVHLRRKGFGVYRVFYTKIVELSCHDYSDMTAKAVAFSVMRHRHSAHIETILMRKRYIGIIHFIWLGAMIEVLVAERLFVALGWAVAILIFLLFRSILSH